MLVRLCKRFMKNKNQSSHAIARAYISKPKIKTFKTPIKMKFLFRKSGARDNLHSCQIEGILEPTHIDMVHK